MFLGGLSSIILMVFGIPLSLVALVALFTALFLLMPQPIREARMQFELHPWRSILLGAVNGLGVAALMLIGGTLYNNLDWSWQPYMMGILVVIGLLVGIPTLIGLSGIVMIIGERLGTKPRPFFTYLRGGGLLLLGCITPVVGWFIFLPLTIFASLGSVVSLLAKSRQANLSEPPIIPGGVNDPAQPQVSAPVEETKKE